MAFDPSKPFTVEEQPVAAQNTVESTVEPTSVGFDPTKPFTVEKPPRYEDTIFGYTDKEQKKLLKDPSIIDYAVAYGGEILIGESTKAAGTAIGTAVNPGVGSGVGYVLSGLLGGYNGSKFRQDSLRPGEPYNVGELVSDSFVNLIPALGKGKKIQKIGGAFATDRRYNLHNYRRG